MKRFLSLFAALSLCGQTAVAGLITPEVLLALPQSDVVVLGEVHDNPAHHANQAAAVGALKPAALVFEMLTPEQGALVTPALRDDEAALGKALGWAESGWPDFALYYPIFAAAPEAAIYGAALPHDDVRRAIGEGAAAVFGTEAGAYGLTQALSEEVQAARDAGQMEAHCNALPPEMLPGMVEAQRLRDAALARAVAKASAATGGPVVVITGNGHARKDWGLAASLAQAAPALSLISIGQFEAAPEEVPPFDFWLVTDPVAREDHCAAFVKSRSN